MELKHSNQICPSAGTFGLNRTFMELKRLQESKFYFGVTSLNRTFMELKHFSTIDNGVSDIVS